MISEYYTDDELISQLAMFFDETDGSVDLQGALGQITEVDENTFQVIINGRTFQFDKVLCGVEEI